MAYYEVVESDLARPHDRSVKVYRSKHRAEKAALRLNRALPPGIKGLLYYCHYVDNNESGERARVKAKNSRRPKKGRFQCHRSASNESPATR